MPKIYADGLPPKPRHTKGFRKQLGGEWFWLGHDRREALSQLRSLQNAYDDLKANGLDWTPETKKAAVTASREIHSSHGDKVVITTTVITPSPPVPIATPEVINPAPAPLPPSGLTLYQGLALYSEFLKQQVPSNSIGEDYRIDLDNKMGVVKRYVPDMPLAQITKATAMTIRGKFTSRPVLENTGKPMSVQYVVNLMCGFGTAIRWMIDNVKTTGWDTTEDVTAGLRIDFKLKQKMRTGDELKADSVPLPCFTLDDLKVIAKYAAPCEWRYVLCGLFLGWTQREISLCVKGNFVQIGGEPYVWQVRHKSKVEGKWWCCDELAAVLRHAINTTSPNNLGEGGKALMFLSSSGKPVLWRNAGESKSGKPKGKNDAIKCMWDRLLKRCRQAGLPQLPFSTLRKTAGTFIDGIAGIDATQTLLCHSPQTIARRHYSSNFRDVGVGKDKFQKLAEALKEMRKALQPMFDARDASIWGTRKQLPTQTSVPNTAPAELVTA